MTFLSDDAFINIVARIYSDMSGTVRQEGTDALITLNSFLQFPPVYGALFDVANLLDRHSAFVIHKLDSYLQFVSSTTMLGTGHAFMCMTKCLYLLSSWLHLDMSYYRCHSIRRVFESGMLFGRLLPLAERHVTHDKELARICAEVLHVYLCARPFLDVANRQEVLQVTSTFAKSTYHSSDHRSWVKFFDFEDGGIRHERCRPFVDIGFRSYVRIFWTHLEVRIDNFEYEVLKAFVERYRQKAWNFTFEENSFQQIKAMHAVYRSIRESERIIRNLDTLRLHIAKYLCGMSVLRHYRDPTSNPKGRLETKQHFLDEAHGIIELLLPQLLEYDDRLYDLRVANLDTMFIERVD